MKNGSNPTKLYSERSDCIDGFPVITNCKELNTMYFYNPWIWDRLHRASESIPSSTMDKCTDAALNYSHPGRQYLQTFRGLCSLRLDRNYDYLSPKGSCWFYFKIFELRIHIR